MAAPNKNILNEKPENILPGVSIDCVVFAYHEGQLKILLNKFDALDKWMLPGGFIFRNEDINVAAHRILKSRTGLDNIYLNQFYSYGKANRIKDSDYEEIEKMLKANNINVSGSTKHWLQERFISVAYYAFVEYSKVELSPYDYADKTNWYNVSEIPGDLYSDHNEIIKGAIATIRMQLGYLPIGFELLPEKFTMTDLRNIYETIIGQKLDRRNFQRKMLSSKYIYKQNEMCKRHGVKAATLFSFYKTLAEEASRNGIPFIF